MSYHSENGFKQCPWFELFVVKYYDQETKFTTLSAAMKFYNMIDAPKALWNCTYLPELLISEGLQE